MGTEFCLACKDCKVFLRVQKWNLDPSRTYDSDPSIYPDNPSYVLSRIDPDQALAQAEADVKEFRTEYPDHWILRMAPLVQTFIAEHRGHDLFLSRSFGEVPWLPGEPELAYWKELDNPVFTFWRAILPRNLIEDFGVRSISEAIDRLKESGDWDDLIVPDDEEYRSAFDIALRLHAKREDAAHSVRE